MIDFTIFFAFAGGFAADLLRRTLLPQSEEWLGRFLPHTRRRQNRQRNLMHLEVRERLKTLGIDPIIADSVEDEGETFVERLRTNAEAKREAFVDAEVDLLTSLARSQSEMNEAVIDRASSFERLVHRRFDEMLKSAGLTLKAEQALIASQEAWLEFQKRDADLESIVVAEGGSMKPLVFGGASEAEAVSRIARLKTLSSYTENGGDQERQGAARW